MKKVLHKKNKILPHYTKKINISVSCSLFTTVLKHYPGRRNLFLVKQIKGVSTRRFPGYRPVWEMGKAAHIKRRQRVTGENRPST